MREFTTAVHAELAVPELSEDSRVPLNTKIDSIPVVLYPLTTSQFVLVAYGLDSGSIMTNAAGVINAFFGMLKTDEQIRRWKQKLWDTNDPFGVEVMVDVMREAIAEWSGNPTQGPSGSSSSPMSTGQPSTVQPAQSEPPAPFASGSTGS